MAFGLVRLQLICSVQKNESALDRKKETRKCAGKEAGGTEHTLEDSFIGLVGNQILPTKKELEIKTRVFHRSVIGKKKNDVARGEEVGEEGP